MRRILILICTVILLCSCASSTQRIDVPSKKFSMMAPPSNWRTIIQTELDEFPEHPGEKIPGGLFTAIWSKNNTSRITIAAGQYIQKANSSGVRAGTHRNALKYSFNKLIDSLRKQGTGCREHTVDSEKDRILDQGVRISELEASIVCTSLNEKSFVKILMYMFNQNGYVYSFELLSPQSDFNRDRKVLDAMIDSFTFIDQAPGKSAAAGTTLAENPDKVAREAQPAEKRFIRIQEPDVVFAGGKVKFTIIFTLMLRGNEEMA